MISVTSQCTGCGSCAAVCPLQCIDMEYDREGFRQPVVDSEKCVNCGKCETVCPLISIRHKNELPEAFAVKNNDTSTRSKSSSGGVFSALARQVILNGGAVCAAVYDEKFSVIHKISCSVEEIEKFSGAKYAQSEAEHCFSEIKELLKKQRPVLFVGTPCQCAGLSSYLGEPQSHLVLVDMICHGVPSPAVWKKYLAERSEIDANGNSVFAVNQRNKDTGWSRYGYSVCFVYENGEQYKVPQGQDLYMLGFTRNLFLRHSCEDCRFKGVQRCTDITLGDYWGIWDFHPEFDDNQGVSLVWLHSAVGKRLWEKVRGNLSYIPTPVETTIHENTSAVQSIRAHEKRQMFFDKLADGFDVLPLIEECLMPPPKKQSFLHKILDRLKIRRPIP